MEHRAENNIEKILHGGAAGFAVALRGCPEDIASAVLERFGGSSVVRVRLFEPCRVEHPHSAFLRKSVESHGRKAIQTMLFSPGGKLTEERAADCETYEHFIKKASDFEVLREHLKDVELLPAKALPSMENCASVACVGLTPIREMETRWAGPELTQWALMAQDEPAASCLRKLERQFHRRCEEAANALCRVGVLRDMAVDPLPETYMLHAGRHIEWMRHAGLAPFVEVSVPEKMLLCALHADHAGARIALANAALHEADFFPPEGMKFMFDADTRDELDGLKPEQAKVLLGKCRSAVILLDCYQAAKDSLLRLVESLLSFQ